MTEGMRWTILIAIIGFAFIVMINRIIVATPSDFQKAKDACNGKLAELHYEYVPGGTQPKFTCK